MRDSPSLHLPQSVSSSSEPLVLPDTGFVRQKLLLRFVPFSKSTLWRQVNAGLFPAPIRLSVGISAWRVEDVQRWIDQRRGPT